jgi:hypothetical protein
MEHPQVLSQWLCLSQTGALLAAHLPAAHRDQHCHLCDLPFGVINEALPCLHWSITPYRKAERMAAVFANFGAADVVRYLLVWMQAEGRRHARRALRCVEHTEHAGCTEIHIEFSNRRSTLYIDTEHAARFEHRHGRTGRGVLVPVMLAQGEAASLRQLAQLACAWERGNRARQAGGASPLNTLINAQYA